jgi:hypothetical protein
MSPKIFVVDVQQVLSSRSVALGWVVCDAPLLQFSQVQPKVWLLPAAGLSCWHLLTGVQSAVGAAWLQDQQRGVREHHCW